MQIDVNAAADRLHLTRAQLTSARSAQLNPKASVSTDGRTLTDLVSKPVTLTDLSSTPGKNISDVRTNPQVMRAPTIVPMPRTIQPDRTGTTNPTPRRIVGPGVDLKSSAQAVTGKPVVSDPGPAKPVNRLGGLLAKLAGVRTQQPQEPHGDVADPSLPSVRAPAEPRLSDPSRPNDSRSDPVEPLNPLDLDALLAAWGEKDSPYDFDGNGIVGVNDLLILLAKLTSGGSPPRQEPHGDVASPQQPSPSALAEPPAHLKTPVDYGPVSKTGDPVEIGANATAIAEPVIDNLDRNDGSTIAPPKVVPSTPTFDRLDRNHDGTLSRRELAAQIRNMLLDHIAMSPNAKLDQFVREAMKRLSDHDNRNGAPGERDAAVKRSSQAYQRMNLEEIAHKLMQRLADDGPSGLANLVKGGTLAANDTKDLINRISMLSPNKLGVNVVG